MGQPEIHIALLHYPIVNKAGDIVATAVTNLDIHDNARSSRAYGISSFHIVTPLDAQIELVTRILSHWQDGFGAKRIPSRVEAMDLVKISRTLDDAVAAVKGDRDVDPIIVATSAREVGAIKGYREFREIMMDNSDVPYLVIFGTGYGLAPEILDRADVILEPIGTPSDWNHLSVRSAVAITLDRLLGVY
ncbi:MAG: RNA methyltransferase [Deltaproteobacteria bacterium]|nr:RNA methyltransferase [Deltaproteobacteria bacterium]